MKKKIVPFLITAAVALVVVILVVRVPSLKKIVGL
jgi:hypothetical protein